MFAKQLSVIKGQSFNLIEILRRSGTPCDLVARPLVTLIEESEVMTQGIVQKSKKSLHRVKQSCKYRLCFC
jgi:hypothetical protein